MTLDLNILNEVDKFIISESTRTHQGQKKNINFKISNFPKFKDKIKFIVIADFNGEVNFMKHTGGQ